MEPLNAEAAEQLTAQANDTSKYTSTKINRFTKPIGHMFSYKTSFFDNNATLVDGDLPKFTMYTEQPLRTCCKMCLEDVANCPVIGSIHGSEWRQCSRCTHVFGVHEDTVEYSSFLYLAEKGADYGAVYNDQDEAAYTSRVQDVYVPKIEFLFEALRADGVKSPEMLSYMDLGCNMGHAASALVQCSVPPVHIIGYDASESGVKKGNIMMGHLYGASPLEVIEMDDVYNKVRTTQSNVVSMIGVLEHVREPRMILAALKANPAIGYLYISVPCYSIAFFLEMMNPGTYSRQVGPGHTHLYTSESLQCMADEHGMERLAEWWFGCDMMDLFRHISVDLGQNKGQPAAAQAMGQMLLPVLNDLQSAIDKTRASSEVHMVFKFKR